MEEWYVCAKRNDNPRVTTCTGPFKTALIADKYYQAIEDSVYDSTMLSVNKLNPFKKTVLKYNYDCLFNRMIINTIKKPEMPSLIL